jgi:hypothetical protein
MTRTRIGARQGEGGPTLVLLDDGLLEGGLLDGGLLDGLPDDVTGGFGDTGVTRTFVVEGATGVVGATVVVGGCDVVVGGREVVVGGRDVVTGGREVVAALVTGRVVRTGTLVTRGAGCGAAATGARRVAPAAA